MEIQDVDESSCTSIGDNSKEEPIFASGTGDMSVARSATVSKQALMAARYICAGNPEHQTFETTKGKPYMEGHHLIPCTYKNVKYFWEKQRINIDCQANIVCLCPTCHRQIHYGADNVKRELIRKLYIVAKEKFEIVGISLTENDLLRLYSLE